MSYSSCTFVLYHFEAGAIFYYVPGLSQRCTGLCNWKRALPCCPVHKHASTVACQASCTHAHLSNCVQGVATNLVPGGGSHDRAATHSSEPSTAVSSSPGKIPVLLLPALYATKGSKPSTGMEFSRGECQGGNLSSTHQLPSTAINCRYVCHKLPPTAAFNCH